METTLMIVTIIALALALGMSGVAWRLLRENKHKTAARADALRQMAEEEAPLADEEEWDAAVLGSGVPEFRGSGVLRFRVLRFRVLRFRGSGRIEPEPRNLGTWNLGTRTAILNYEF